MCVCVCVYVCPPCTIHTYLAYMNKHIPNCCHVWIHVYELCVKNKLLVSILLPTKLWLIYCINLQQANSLMRFTKNVQKLAEMFKDNYKYIIKEHIAKTNLVLNC